MILGIYGASGLGREMLETANLICSKTGKYSQIVFVDDDPNLDNVQGHKVYGLEDAATQFHGNIEIVLAIGEPVTRIKVIERVKFMGIDFTSLVHPDVLIPETTCIGIGTYIAPQSFISCNVIIGDQCIIQPNVNIGHDCVLGFNVSVCGMTTLGGNCRLGNNVFVGMGSSVIQGCTIGKESIIGMGSVVFKDIPENVVALGNPARVMKNARGEKVFK